MKNILVICSNIIVALQIKTYYSKNRDKNNYIFLIEKNNSSQEVIKIFNDFKYKKNI